MIVGSKSPNAIARVLIRGSYINETGSITSLFRLLNEVKDCTPVSLNHALLRLSITPVRLDITQVCLNNAPVTLFTVRPQRWK